MKDPKIALIVGAGAGISASLCRRLSASGAKVALASRNPGKLADLCTETGARAFRADTSSPAEVERLFADVDKEFGEADLVVFNASARERGSLLDLDPRGVEAAIRTSAFGGFLAVQQAARRMVPKGSGSILLTGATASVKGYALSAAFAMGKFALRGLAQSAARELGPKGIHVAHFIIDGVVGHDAGDTRLNPDAIAQAYVDVIRQDRSAWSHEIDLRPWVETF